MRKFIRNTLFFIIPFLIFLIGKSIYNYKLLIDNVSHAIKRHGDKPMFLVGDSQIEALSIDKCDARYVNIGQGGEALDVSICKILTLNRKKSNKVYFMGFAEHNIVYNPKMAEEKKRWLFKLKLYNDQDNLAWLIVSDFPSFVRYITFERVAEFGFGDGTGTGNPNRFNAKEVRDPGPRIRKSHYTTDSTFSLNDITRKLVALSATLAQNHSSLVLVNLPTTNLYKRYIPKNISTNYRKIAAQLTSQGIEMMMLDKITLSDSFFFDPYHMNVYATDTMYKAGFRDRKQQ